MPDDFWAEWVQLSNLGHFSFEENEVLGQEDTDCFPGLFAGPTSNLFSLMRNLISYELLHGYTVDLGSVYFQWNYDQYTILQVIENGAEAFKRMCLLNERLSNAV